MRVDSGVEEGGEVTPFYDPMIAKIIAHGGTREEALDRLSSALSATVVAGPKCNVAFLKNLVDAEEFRDGAVDTGFIDAHAQQLGAQERPLDPKAVAAGAAQLLRLDYDRVNPTQPVRNRLGSRDWLYDPWEARQGFELAGRRHTLLPLTAEGTEAKVELYFDEKGPSLRAPGQDAEAWPRIDWNPTRKLSELGDGSGVVVRGGDDKVYVIRNGRQTAVAFVDPLDVDLDHLEEGAGGLVKSPMHGKLVALLVAEGESVVKGQRLAVVEAMKMEHALTAPLDGTISGIVHAAGEQVPEGAPLMRVTAA